MAVSVSVLASGSRGNTAVVRTSTTRILVDAGISCRETFKRMKALGEDPHSLSAIVITHEHCRPCIRLGHAGQEVEDFRFHDRRHAPVLGARPAR